MEVLSIPHQLILQDRTSVELTGVTSVDNFDDTVVLCTTSKGTLTIRGSKLHLSRLDLDATLVSVDGEIDSLVYTDIRKGGAFSRLFR